MVKLTFIRHAQCEFNVNKSLTPEQSVDSKLTTEGVIQASHLNFHFDMLILSPLKRAMQTYTNSEIITSKVIISEFVREWLDNPANFLKGEYMSLNTSSDVKFESEEDLEDRVDKAIFFIKCLCSMHEYTNIGIITHFQFIRAVGRKLKGEDTKIKNCEFLEIELQL
jgi:broad specificity phosphatase PhoE